MIKKYLMYMCMIMIWLNDNSMAATVLVKYSGHVIPSESNWNVEVGKGVGGRFVYETSTDGVKDVLVDMYDFDSSIKTWKSEYIPQLPLTDKYSNIHQVAGAYAVNIYSDYMGPAIWSPMADEVYFEYSFSAGVGYWESYNYQLSVRGYNLFFRTGTITNGIILDPSMQSAVLEVVAYREVSGDIVLERYTAMIDSLEFKEVPDLTSTYNLLLVHD